MMNFDPLQHGYSRCYLRCIKWNGDVDPSSLKSASVKTQSNVNGSSITTAGSGSGVSGQKRVQELSTSSKRSTTGNGPKSPSSSPRNPNSTNPSIPSTLNPARSRSTTTTAAIAKQQQQQSSPSPKKQKQKQKKRVGGMTHDYVTLSVSSTSPHLQFQSCCNSQPAPQYWFNSVSPNEHIGEIVQITGLPDGSAFKSPTTSVNGNVNSNDHANANANGNSATVYSSIIKNGSGSGVGASVIDSDFLTFDAYLNGELYGRGKYPLRRGRIIDDCEDGLFGKLTSANSKANTSVNHKNVGNSKLVEIYPINSNGTSNDSGKSLGSVEIELCYVGEDYNVDPSIELILNWRNKSRFGKRMNGINSNAGAAGSTAGGPGMFGGFAFHSNSKHPTRTILENVNEDDPMSPPLDKSTDSATDTDKDNIENSDEIETEIEIDELLTQLLKLKRTKLETAIKSFVQLMLALLDIYNLAADQDTRLYRAEVKNRVRNGGPGAAGARSSMVAAPRLNFASQNQNQNQYQNQNQNQNQSTLQQSSQLQFGFGVPGPASGNAGLGVSFGAGTGAHDEAEKKKNMAKAAAQARLRGGGSSTAVNDGEVDWSFINSDDNNNIGNRNSAISTDSASTTGLSATAGGFDGAFSDGANAGNVASHRFSTASAYASNFNLANSDSSSHHGNSNGKKRSANNSYNYSRRASTGFTTHTQTGNTNKQTNPFMSQLEDTPPSTSTGQKYRELRNTTFETIVHILDLVVARQPTYTYLFEMFMLELLQRQVVHSTTLNLANELHSARLAREKLKHQSALSNKRRAASGSSISFCSYSS
ncbi:unnamed protein product [Ambrosiozyma monospora]|uniref:Unnamed protein product n=1 Tax=Ambrosiozyma monospora TaxID=43982 RepID=A0A9W7DI78_AMBMO|nr:unnamed protein product [Ambrosiozyma monospora]